MCRRITSICLGMVIGPMSVPSGPTVSRPARVTTLSTKASKTASTAYTRSMPMQVWPALVMPPQTHASAAASRSASLSTIMASLPPPSISTGVSVSAQAAITFRAVAVEPVKATLSTPERHSAAPTSPSPCTAVKHRLLGHHLGEAVHQPLADGGRVLARLEHHGVAGGERVRGGADRREDRIVPRPDHADHTVRLVFEVPGELGEDEPGPHPAWTEHAAGVAGGPVDVLDRGDDLDDGVGDRLAALDVHQLGQLLDALGEQGTPPQHPLAAAGEAEPGPPLAGGAGAVDGLPHVGVGGDREATGLGAGRRAGRDQLALVDDRNARDMHCRHGGSLDPRITHR